MCLTFLMKIRHNFLQSNFLTYSQTHSSVFGLSVAPGHKSLLLTPPSYKIAANKGTINEDTLFDNDKACPVRVSMCLNGLSICLSKHQPFTRCHFQVPQNSVDNFHVFLIEKETFTEKETSGRRKIVPWFRFVNHKALILLFIN